MSEGFTGERLSEVDGEFGVDLERHLAAYRFARVRAAGRTVLDAGCGEGYGAALLAEVAARVVGADRTEAIALAAARHREPRLELRGIDLERRRVRSGPDVAVIGPVGFTVGDDGLDRALDLMLVAPAPAA